MIKPHLFSVFDTLSHLVDETPWCASVVQCDLPDADAALDYTKLNGGTAVLQRDLTTLQRIEVAIYRRESRYREASHDTTDDGSLRLTQLVSRIRAIREHLIPKVAAEFPESVIQPWYELNPNCTKTQIRVYVAIQYLDSLLITPEVMVHA